MKKYFLLFRLSLEEYFAFRLNFALEVLGGIFVTIATVMVWKVIYTYESAKIIVGFSPEEMITYVLLGGAIFGFLHLTSQGDEINDDINKGKLSNILLKPLHPNMYWFVRDLSRKLLTFSIGMIAYVIAFIFFAASVVPPHSFANFCFFILFILIASIIHFGLFYIFSIIAFWFDQTWGMRFLMRVVIDISAGGLIPLTFFSSFMQRVFSFMPFQFFAFVPLQTYLGHADKAAISSFMVQAAAWIVIIYTIAYIIWKKGIKQYTALGS